MDWYLCLSFNLSLWPKNPTPHEVWYLEIKVNIGPLRMAWWCIAVSSCLLVSHRTMLTTACNFTSSFSFSWSPITLTLFYFHDTPHRTIRSITAWIQDHTTQGTLDLSKMDYSEKFQIDNISEKLWAINNKIFQSIISEIMKKPFGMECRTLCMRSDHGNEKWWTERDGGILCNVLSKCILSVSRYYYHILLRAIIY